MKEIKIGLIGFGTIGCGVVKVLKKRTASLEKKLGIKLSLKVICDQDITRKRDVVIGKSILTTDIKKVINDKEIQIVIELVGGIHPAKEYIIAALRNKKYVVTANKALLATAGEEIFDVAAKNGVDVYFEASVGSGIPIIRALREGLVSNQVESIYGIVNGTSNYILSEMSQRGCNFKTALAQARKKGYAETDYSLDINGQDSAHKIVILARMCFGQKINFSEVYVEGINNISLSDIEYAAELGFCIKLLAITKVTGDNLQIRVHPTFLPKRHLLSNVDGVFNAIFVNADLVGEMLLYGQGAGQMPTASAVISDVVTIAQKITQAPLCSKQRLYVKGSSGPKKIQPIDEIKTRYYIRFSAVDKPAVLSQISAILGKEKISIHSVIQKGRQQNQAVPIVMMTHEARGKNLRKALAKIDKLPAVKRKTVAIRVERL